MSKHPVSSQLIYTVYSWVSNINTESGGNCEIWKRQDVVINFSECTFNEILTSIGKLNSLESGGRKKSSHLEQFYRTHKNCFTPHSEVIVLVKTQENKHYVSLWGQNQRTGRPVCVGLFPVWLSRSSPSNSSFQLISNALIYHIFFTIKLNSFNLMITYLNCSFVHLNSLYRITHTSHFKLFFTMSDRFHEHIFIFSISE